ncbi:hypothetical protein GRZ59_14595 [Lactobacillus paracasei]|nr:hypothetical protein [Lacticaseibacillus paracasei]
MIHARNPSFLGTQYIKIKSARKICTRTELINQRPLKIHHQKTAIERFRACSD